MPSHSPRDYHSSWTKATQTEAQTKLLLLPRTVRFLQGADDKLSGYLSPNFQRPSLVSCCSDPPGSHTCPTDQQVGTPILLLPVSPPFPSVFFACLRPPRVALQTTAPGVSCFLNRSANEWLSTAATAEGKVPKSPYLIKLPAKPIVA